ncbi:MAG: response regulator transcription factor [Clostridia bacterium]|nr:response regulator transcription factor [Clostridia bacterium]
MIYLLEDDDNIRKLIEYALSSQNMKTVGFARPSEFWETLENEIPSLLLLDIMLPEEDGLSILKKLRSLERTKNLPIIMLTAKGTEYDKVIGLDTGADDYLAKPFGMTELIARIKALLRRSSYSNSGTELTVGDLKIVPEKHTVTLRGEEISLSYKEYELLLALVKADGKVLTRDVLLNLIWGYDFDGETRTVDVHIRHLRAKLGDESIIETVKGVGYKIGGVK